MRIKCWPVEPQAGGWAAGKTMTALPAARTTEMIASDIRNGYLSPERASAVYGYKP